MERPTYLEHYRVMVDSVGAPVELRRNGQHVVYQAEDLRSGQEVALGVIRDFSPENLDRLEEETRRAERIAHLNLPRILEVGREPGRVVYATENFVGTPAEEWIEEHGPMPVGPVLRIGLQAVSALGAATYHSVSHGAINPRHVLLVPGQTAQGDWPLIKILGLVGPLRSFAGSQFAGEAADFEAQFASPEQWQNRPVDFRSEIYSLGATLWYLLTGAPPAPAEELDRVSGLSKPVLKLLEEMLARPPEARPHDPVAFEEEIRKCLDQVERRAAIGRKFGVPAVAPIAVVKKSEPRPPWTMGRTLAVAAVVLLFMGLGIFFWSANLRPGRSLLSNSAPIGVPIGVPDAADAVEAKNGADRVPNRSSTAAVDLASRSVASATPADASASDIDLVEPSAPGEGPGAPARLAQTAPMAQSGPSVAPGAEPPPPPIVAENDSAEISSLPSETAENPIKPDFSNPDVAGLPEPSQDTAPVVAAGSPESQPEPTAVAEVQAPRRPEPASTPTPVVAQRAKPATIQGLPVRRAEPIQAVDSVTEIRPIASPERTGRRFNGLEVRAAEPAENTPGLPKRSRRARFLGTTPDGEMVFELPSAEEGFVAPRR